MAMYPSQKVGGGTEYSTTERIVGTWVDGSPLYEQTVEYTPDFLSSDYNKMVEQPIVTLPSSYKLRSCEIRVTWSTDDDRYCIILPYQDYSNSGAIVTAMNWYYGINQLDNTKNQLYYRAYFTYDPTVFNKKLYATLRYTK